MDFYAIGLLDPFQDTFALDPVGAWEVDFARGVAQATSTPVRAPQQGSRLRTVLSRKLCRSLRYEEEPSLDSGDLLSVGSAEQGSISGPFQSWTKWWCGLQRKVLRRRGWACRFQNPGGSGSRVGGNFQRNERNFSRRVGVSRLASSQPGEVETSPLMVGGDSA